MSCWSLESPLSFMLAADGGAQVATAGMAEPHPHGRRGVPRSLPAPPPLPRCLTTRNQQRAPAKGADREAGQGEGPGGASRLCAPAPLAL